MEDPIDLAMVEAINRLGQLMGKRTIAECVESEALLALLKNIDVVFFGSGIDEYGKRR